MTSRRAYFTCTVSTGNLSSSVEHQTQVIRDISDNCEALIASQKASSEELVSGFGDVKLMKADIAAPTSLVEVTAEVKFCEPDSRL